MGLRLTGWEKSESRNVGLRDLKTGRGSIDGRQDGSRRYCCRLCFLGERASHRTVSFQVSMAVAAWVFADYRMLLSTSHFFLHFGKGQREYLRHLHRVRLFNKKRAVLIDDRLLCRLEAAYSNESIERKRPSEGKRRGGSYKGAGVGTKSDHARER